MKRFPARFLGFTLLIGSAACAPYTSVGVTASESVVSGCQKVGDVAASPSAAPNEVNGALSDAARAKGANYVLVASDGARAGTAYRCSMPTAASR
ncbi:MAG: hypothetical protein ACM3SU_03690 [Acidobacteriota bacterium]